MDRLYCLAGEFRQSVYYRRQYGFSQREWGYIGVGSLHTLRGLLSPHYVRVGTWYERPDLVEILEALYLCRAIEIPVSYLESRPA